MEISKLVKFLRLSVKVQDSEDTLIEKDTKYLEMSDEDLILILEIVATRDFPKLPSLSYITPDMVYPLTLLAKKELYHTLAVKEAPLYDMGADNNNYLRQSQRFDHYTKLIIQVNDEYNQYIEDGGAGGNVLSSYDVLLTTRYATKRNYDKGEPPALSVYIREVGCDFVSLSWEYTTNLFLNIKVYLSNHNIYNSYAPTKSEKVDPKSTLAYKTFDAKQSSIKLKGLKPDTKYYVLVVVTNMSGLCGYYQVDFETESVLKDIDVKEILISGSEDSITSEISVDKEVE